MDTTTRRIQRHFTTRPSLPFVSTNDGGCWVLSARTTSSCMVFPLIVPLYVAGRSRGGLSFRTGPPRSAVYVPATLNLPSAFGLIGAVMLPCAHSNSSEAPDALMCIDMPRPPQTSKPSLPLSCPAAVRQANSGINSNVPQIWNAWRNLTLSSHCYEILPDCRLPPRSTVPAHSALQSRRA